MRTITQSNKRLASIMDIHRPQLKDNTVVYLQLKNVTQQKELNNEKSRIFGFLRRKLKNAYLSLETEVVNNEKTVTKAFTAAERAKLMADKNPTLLLLKNKFDLDVEI